MILPGTGFVGNAAWQCGNCQRVETLAVPQVTCYYVETPPRCSCGGYEGAVRIVYLMQPLNDLARSMDGQFSDQMNLWSLKQRALKHMTEVNW